MELYDENDRKAIKWGLDNVFSFNVEFINVAIAAQVSEIPHWIHHCALLI